VVLLQLVPKELLKCLYLAVVAVAQVAVAVLVVFITALLNF
jgi:hypothetical protein